MKKSPKEKSKNFWESAVSSSCALTPESIAEFEEVLKKRESEPDEYFITMSQKTLNKIMKFGLKP